MSNLKIFSILSLQLIFLSSLTFSKELVVNTLNGQVKGTTYDFLIEEQNFVLNAWYGIPYAQPPVGKLRFKRPNPVDNWQDILDATSKKKPCFQSATVGVEDCLYLNIIKPANISEKLPVLFWIHGGGFVDGSPYNKDPSVIVGYSKVIYVSVAYRLSLFGFLYMNDTNAPGNMGLLDQNMALQWVYNNIEFFGGDKERITLFGQSAGAKSVGLHLVSGLSSGFFRNAILNSGSPVADFVITKNNNSIDRNTKFLNFIGCKGNTNEMILCAKNYTAKDLHDKSTQFKQNISSFIFGPDPPFSPVVDNFFLDDEPTILLRTGRFRKCSIITGTNLNEGNAFLQTAFPKEYNTPTAPNFDYPTFTQILTSFFHYYPKYPTLSSESIRQTLLYRYTNWTNPFNYESILRNLDAAVGDFNYACPCTALCDYYALNGLDVYRFFNTHQNSLHSGYKWMGVEHGEELAFVYGEPLHSNKFKPSEVTFSKKLLDYWSNFIKYDNPNRDPRSGEIWPKYTVNNSPNDNFQRAYLTLDADQNYLGFSLKADLCAFWNNLLPYYLKLNNK